METQQLGIIALIRSAIKNEELVLPADFDLQAAADTIYHHHLTALAVRGAIRCGLSPSAPELRSLTAEFCREVSVSRRQMQHLAAVYSAFQKNGIDYMPVKGAVLKSLYPQPELRVMGDADILIRQEQYPLIQRILPALGLTKGNESDHEYIWYCTDFKLELHKRLIPSYNKDYYAFYGDGWNFARPDGNGTAYTMRPEDHFLYLILHFAKHYRDGSISAKSVCDFWIWQKAYPQMDEAYLHTQLQAVRLLSFYRNILDLLNTWFEGAAPTDAVEIMTQTIFQGGVYTNDASNQTFSVIKLTAEGKNISGSKRILLLNLLFPPANVLTDRYPILGKAPGLLPVFWLVRFFETVFLHGNRRKRGMEKLQNLKSINPEKLTDYQQKLRSVGLDYNLQS